MRAIIAATVAVAVAIATGALATRARAASALIGMTPNPATLIDKNSTAALKQLLLETKSGPGAKIGPHLLHFATGLRRPASGARRWAADEAAALAGAGRIRADQRLRR